jgi:hypothetical protein
MDVVVREIWNEAYMTKQWCGYDRLILGIFCFDDVLVCCINSTFRSTKKKTKISWRVIINKKKLVTSSLKGLTGLAKERLVFPSIGNQSYSC